MQYSQIQTARAYRHGAIQHDQADQQNDTAEREIDCHFPGGSAAIPGSPDSNEEEGRDQRELVKSVEEK